MWVLSEGLRVGASALDCLILDWEALQGVLDEGAVGSRESLSVHFWPCWLLLVACVVSSGVLGVSASAQDRFVLVWEASWVLNEGASGSRESRCAHEYVRT